MPSSDSHFEGKPWIYDMHWNPKSYLRQYYSTPIVADDCEAAMRFAADEARRRQLSNARILDFGSGPTIWGVLSLSPFASEIHFSDYVSENLDAIREWVRNEPDAHDWSVYMRSALELYNSNKPSEPMSATDFHSHFRKSIAGYYHADAFVDPAIPTAPPPFDVVVSHYCLECIQTDKSQWQIFMRRLADLVSPGGTLFLSSILHSGEYLVEGKRFPVTRLSLQDIQSELIALNFPEEHIELRSVPIEAWKNEGFDQVCLAAATKRHDQARL